MPSIKPSNAPPPVEVVEEAEAVEEAAEEEAVEEVEEEEQTPQRCNQ
jgi:hypothetical protein